MKMRYRVFLQQFVEQIAVVEISADSPEQARDIALQDPSAAAWQDSENTPYDFTCYCIKDMDGNEIWYGPRSFLEKTRSVAFKDEPNEY